MGETRWNRSATSGKAASHTTVEATMPSNTRAPARRSALRHAGSNRRSRSSSAERGPKNRPRIVSKMCRIKAHAGDTSQTSAPIARKESWQPTSNRYIGLIARVNRAASDSVLAGRASRWAMAAEQNVDGHDGRAHDRRGRSNQQGVAEHRQADDQIRRPVEVSRSRER